MLSKNSRIVIGTIIALLLIVAVYAVAQPRISRNHALNSINNAKAQSGDSNTGTRISSNSKIITNPTAVATIQPTALPAQKQPSNIENTTPIKIIAYNITAYGNSPAGGFNFGSSSLDRYCVYKLQEDNKNMTIQRHAEYWMDYIATNLEGMHNISEFEHRYNLTYSNCVERLTKNANNGSKPVENAEKKLITVK